MACRSNTKEKLLANPHIWKQGSVRTGRTAPLASGFNELDAWLDGGWPGAAITELLLTGEGIGELRLVLPALQKLQQVSASYSNTGARGQVRQVQARQVRVPGQQQLCWVNPPYIPYAPALARHGLDLSQLLVVQPESAVDALWAMDQALRSRACAAVLGWFDRINRPSIRRLQVIAESSACPGFVFRHARFARHDSAAPLRIHLTATNTGWQLDILRNRYGRTGRLRLSC